MCHLRLDFARFLPDSRNLKADMNAVMPQSHGDDHAMPGVLHSRKPDDEIEFYAFDMLVSDGDVIRKLSLSMRKTNLARLLGGAPARQI